jgi:hypothetical protein
LKWMPGQPGDAILDARAASWLARLDGMMEYA